MNLGLKNKYALVTGGSHGIGRAIALGLASEGCNIAICARGVDNLIRVAFEIENNKVEALEMVADVIKSRDIDATVKTIIEHWGKLHILINNVGGGGRWGTDIFEESPEEIWHQVYTKNAVTAIKFTMKFLPYMLKQKWGRVITISSIYGKEAGGRPWFSMAKSAEISLMKNLAINPRYAGKGITFNTICPGAIMIPDTGWDVERKENPRQFKQFVKKELPRGRLGTPEEVANLVTFLCSTKASLINGATITADGGQSRSF